MLLYLKRLKKTHIPVSEFAGILERVIDEFRPAFILQLHNAGFMKEVKNLTRILKTSVAHAALINSAYEISQTIEFGINPHFTAARIRRVLIPALQLLKQPKEMENQELEIVRRIEEILENPKTKEILKKSCLGDEDIIGMILPFPALSYKLIGKNMQACRAISDIEHYLDNKRAKEPISVSECENKKYREKLMYRRASLPGYSTRDPYFKLLYKDKLSIEIISKLSAANDTFNPPLFQLDKTLDSLEADSGVDEKVQSPVKFLFAFDSPDKKPSSSMIPKPIQLPFEGSAVDMNQNSESEESGDEAVELRVESPKLKEVEMTPVKEEAKEVKEVIESAKIDMKIHKFQESFDELLSVEKEPSSDKIWKHVVNKPGTQVFQKKSGDSPICMIKAFCEVDYSAETVFQAIWDTTVRTKWDSLFNEFRIIDGNDDYEVLYYMIKTPFGITRRDWLQRRIQIRNYPEPNTIILHFCSMEHQMMPPRKGVIRAETLISGYIIRPKTQRSCTVTIISQNDIKGLIPKSIVNSVASKAPADWVNNMKKGCKMVAGY